MNANGKHRVKETFAFSGKFSSHIKWVGKQESRPLVFVNDSRGLEFWLRSFSIFSTISCLVMVLISFYFLLLNFEDVFEKLKTFWFAFFVRSVFLTGGGLRSSWVYSVDKCRKHVRSRSLGLWSFLLNVWTFNWSIQEVLSGFAGFFRRFSAVLNISWDWIYSALVQQFDA